MLVLIVHKGMRFDWFHDIGLGFGLVSSWFHDGGLVLPFFLTWLNRVDKRNGHGTKRTFETETSLWF